MNITSYKVSLVAAISLIGFSGATALAMSRPTNAHAAEADTSNTPTSSSDASASSSGQQNEQSNGKPADDGSKEGTHLAAAKLQACKKRQSAINNIMARIVDRESRQIAVFDTIATRTETFYVSKGKTVANYATLVAAIGTAKAKAESDLASMKTTDTMMCDAANPKGVMSAFKTSRKLEINDLKVYRTAVKNLIVAVKSVQGSVTNTDATSSSSTRVNKGAQN